VKVKNCNHKAKHVQHYKAIINTMDMLHKMFKSQLMKQFCALWIHIKAIKTEFYQL